MALRLSIFVLLCFQARVSQSTDRRYKSQPSNFYAHYSQPDDVDSGNYDSVNYAANNLCTRSCDVYSPKICYYEFHLEQYSTLNQACGNCTFDGICTTPNARGCVLAGGYERSMLTVNRRLSGPSIQVCKGDTIVVDVINQMPGRSTTIHWHGFDQRSTPHMDGVPMVTQCPIPEATTFRYKFPAADAGTYFWHSHDGFQKMDGIIGSIVVRQASSEVINSQYYDYDLPSHVVLIEDWFYNTTSDERFPGFRLHDGGQEADTYLINGKGSYPGTRGPYAVFTVKAGKRYRFRFISGTCTACPFQVSIQAHPLTLIYVDKTPVQPITVDAFAAVAGERYDFVIEASQPSSSYWIHVKGLGGCGDNEVFQLGVLKYDNSLYSEPPSAKPGYTGYPVKKLFNQPNADCKASNSSNVTNFCVSQLQNREPVDSLVLSKLPDLRILMSVGFHQYSVKELFQTDDYLPFYNPVPQAPPFVANINNITNRPTSSPLLSQYNDIPPEEFCSHECVYNKSPELCVCTNIIKLPKDKLIELVIADSSGFGLTHPMHLHGHFYYVLDQGVFSGNQTFEESIHLLNQRLNTGYQTHHTSPIQKDTVPLPSGGYFVVRIITDNPGFWFFHCHFLYHQVAGMNAVFQVGELTDMLPAPKGFPCCGNFL